MTTDYQQNQFNHSLLRAIQEASPDGILVVDQHSHITSFNQRFLDIWQIDEECRPDEQAVFDKLPHCCPVNFHSSTI